MLELKGDGLYDYKGKGDDMRRMLMCILTLMYVFGGVGGAQGWSKLATDSTAWTSLAQEQLSQLSVSSDQDQLMKAVPQGTTQSSPANMSSNGGFAPLSVAGDQCRAGVYASL